jgi:hypothetical protein
MHNMRTLQNEEILGWYCCVTGTAVVVLDAGIFRIYTNYIPATVRLDKYIWKEKMNLKQLEVRNTDDGMIWQIYHVDMNAPHEQLLLEKAAKGNGFQSVKLNNELSKKETWPGWRDAQDWKDYCKREGVTLLAVPES